MNVQKRTWGIFGLVVAVIFLLVGLVSAGQIVENLDANEIMVIQSPIEGRLDVYTSAGLKWQWFGTVTKYPRRAEYAFSDRGNVNPETPLVLGVGDNSKRLRFNDGGHANLYGAVSWEMPLTKEAIIKVHKTFTNEDGIEQQAIAKMIDAAVYLAGPLMSSTESSGARRAELVQVINDQAENGVYVTHATESVTTDPITGAEKTITVTTIARDDNGNPKRQQSSILTEFDIQLLPLSINELKYDAIVENQIKERQEATTRVQIAAANAIRAEQDVITAKAQGEANAATAKWKQEVVKATQVVIAEQAKEVAELAAAQRLEVAKLDALAAEEFKRAEILKGEGESTRKKLVLNADGALAQKLEAMVQMNKDQWTAIASYGGAWVPAVVMGQDGSAQEGNGANALVNLLTAKTAKELGVDLSVPRGLRANK